MPRRSQESQFSCNWTTLQQLPISTEGGGTASPKLSQLTKDLWLWCMERNILLQAQHLPGVLNTIADKESRTRSDRSEWKLSPILFQEINHLVGPLSTDLFASISTPSICELEARSSSSSHRCIYSGLEYSSREVVYQSTLGSDRQSPVASTHPRSSGARASSTNLESPSLISLAR